MSTVMTNLENNTISMYWNTLRSMSKNIRLALAVKLTNSVLEEERERISDEAFNKKMDRTWSCRYVLFNNCNDFVIVTFPNVWIICISIRALVKSAI